MKPRNALAAISRRIPLFFMPAYAALFPFRYNEPDQDDRKTGPCAPGRRFPQKDKPHKQRNEHFQSLRSKQHIPKIPNCFVPQLYPVANAEIRTKEQRQCQ